VDVSTAAAAGPIEVDEVGEYLAEAERLEAEGEEGEEGEEEEEEEEEEEGDGSDGGGTTKEVEASGGSEEDGADE